MTFRRSLLLCAVLAALTSAAYWPVLRNDFVQYDDDVYILDNPHVATGLSWANAQWAFTTGHSSNWHPLTWLSHQLDVTLFGLRPPWHHLENLLFHIANSLLLFLALRRLTGASLEVRPSACGAPADSLKPDPQPAPSPSLDSILHPSTNWPPATPAAVAWRCFFVAALFAVHPLHVESVAWAAERKDVLSGFFFMLTLWAYACYAQARKPAIASYLLCLGFFALGLLSKPMLVTLPFLLLLLDYWPLGRFAATTRQGERPGKPLGEPANARLSLGILLVEKAPFLVLCLASSIVTFLVQRYGHATSTVGGLPLEPRVTNAILSYVKYVGKTFWPTHLAVFYPHPGIRGPAGEPPEWEFAMAMLFLVGLSALVVARRARAPWLTIGWFWFLGTLVPVLGLVQVGGQSMADRYMYLPSIGLFIMVVWWAADFFGRGGVGKVALATGGAAAVLACAVVTERQANYWRNSLTLFEHALAVTEYNPVAEYMVSLEYLRQGKYGLAEQHLQKTLEADPNYYEAHCALGSRYLQEGKLEEAIVQYEQALKVKPWSAEANNGLGAALWREGRAREAREHYAAAVRFQPDFPEARYNLGVAFAAEGKHQEAAEQLAEAIRLRPNNIEALSRLAREYLQLGKLTEAQACFRELVGLKPQDAGVRVSLAEVLGLSGKGDEAIVQLIEALRLQPDNAIARKDLGTAFLEKARFAEAATNFAAAARLKPDYAVARAGLGRALAAQGRLTEAEAQFREVVRLCPDNAEAEVTLGEALMADGQTNDAAKAFAAALKLEPDLPARNLQTGKELLARGQTEAALARFATAAAIKPDNADAHEVLGTVLVQRGRLEDAAREFEETIRLRSAALEEPENARPKETPGDAASQQSGTPAPRAAAAVAQACYELAMVRVMQGKPRAAVPYYRRALGWDTNNVAALNDLAWLLATDPHDDVRDGAEAMRLAERARDLSGGEEARYWGTLDAAYAEAGRWDAAEQAARKAAALAQAAGQQDLAEAAHRRLSLYANHQPFRQ